MSKRKTKSKSKTEIKSKMKNKLKTKSKLDAAKTEAKIKTNTSSISNKEKSKLGLIDRCKLQMSSSLLRLINEDLYTSDTKHVPLDKDKFLAYHDAYSTASHTWPTQPIDYIAKFIKKRILVEGAKKRLHKFKFADIGCGKEPLLKAKLPPKVEVLSFDLVSTHKDVTEANMESLPVEDEIINCAIYSLSLMATNLGKVLLEAKRILKPKGSLLIVEITSRFEGKEKRFSMKLEKLGLKQKSITQLKPNGYFTFFHFCKMDSKLNYPPSNLEIQLKPCIYKSR